jgi:hypothetical protein
MNQNIQAIDEMAQVFNNMEVVVPTTTTNQPAKTVKPVVVRRSDVKEMPEQLMHFEVNDKYQLKAKPVLQGNVLMPWDPSNSSWLRFVYEVPDLSYGPFRCCGARALAGMDLNGGNLLTTQQQQELVTIWLRRVGGNSLSWYFIASSSQMKHHATTEGRILNLLIKLGAKEIDIRPNYYHTPNSLHMFALSFKDNPNIDNFVKLTITRNRYGDAIPVWNPLWWCEQTAEQEVVLLERLRANVKAFSDWAKELQRQEQEKQLERYLNQFYQILSYSTPDELKRMVNYVKRAYGYADGDPKATVESVAMLKKLNEALHSK